MQINPKIAITALALELDIITTLIEKHIIKRIGAAKDGYWVIIAER